MTTIDAKPASARIHHSSDIDFGIQRVPRSTHVAYFWETEKEFVEAIRFLETGLRGSDYCVIFGHDEANKAVCQVLEERGFNVKLLQDEGRIAVVGGSSSAEKILQPLAALSVKLRLEGRR